MGLRDGTYRASAAALVAGCFSMLLLPRPAHAQCTKDTDCKGARVCSGGVCAEPSPAAHVVPQAPVAAPMGPVPPAPMAPPMPSGRPAPAAAPAPYPAPAPAYAPQPTYYQPGYQPAPLAVAPAPGPPADPGWASGAGIYGIVSGVVALGLAIGAEATKEDTVPSTPLGGVATALFGISLPIVAVGGSSARNNPAVTGSTALRIVAWIGYGITLADAAVLLAQAGGSTPPDGQILSVGLLGVASMACMSTDAFMSANEATRLAQGLPAGASLRRGILVPFVARDPANPQRLATGLSWATRF
jgi:hypothetical protein